MKKTEQKIKDLFLGKTIITDTPIKFTPMKTNFLHEMGKVAIDKVTGFKGTIIGRAEYLSGCNTYGLAPKVGKEGNRIDTEWFDEARLEIISDNLKEEDITGDKNGSDNCQQPKATH